MVSWLTVLSGTWMVYPGYRDVPPEGAALADYPKSWLTANGDLGLWHHSIGVIGAGAATLICNTQPIWVPLFGPGRA